MNICQYISPQSHGWKLLSGLFFSSIHAVIRWVKKVAHGWTFCVYHLSGWRGCTSLTLVYIIHLWDEMSGSWMTFLFGWKMFALAVCVNFEMLFFLRTVLKFGRQAKKSDSTNQVQAFGILEIIVTRSGHGVRTWRTEIEHGWTYSRGRLTFGQKTGGHGWMNRYVLWHQPRFCTWGKFGRHPFCQLLCARNFLIGQPFWAPIGQQGIFWIVRNGTWRDWSFRSFFFFWGPHCFWQFILFFRFYLFGILETVDFTVCPCQKIWRIDLYLHPSLCNFLIFNLILFTQSKYITRELPL
jgi:hypothetical protein